MKPSAKQKTIKSDTVQERLLAGFGRRAGALLIDCIILVFIGRVLGFLLGEQFARLGSDGQFIGYAICIWYFGWHNSSLGRGQTIGKKLLALRVSDREGRYISPGKSCVRAAILAAPVISWGFPIFIALVYFYIFNRITRQSLHDLLTGTFVIKADAPRVPTDFRMWPVHYAIFAAGAIAVAAGGFYMRGTMGADNLDEMRRELVTIPKIYNVSAAVENRSRVGSGESVRNLTVAVFTRDQLTPVQLLEDRIVEIVLKELPPAHDFEAIRICISKGYDIGIAKGFRTDQAVFSPRSPGNRMHAVGFSW